MTTLTAMNDKDNDDDDDDDYKTKFDNQDSGGMKRVKQRQTDMKTFQSKQCQTGASRFFRNASTELPLCACLQGRE